MVAIPCADAGRYAAPEAALHDAELAALTTGLVDAGLLAIGTDAQSRET